MTATDYTWDVTGAARRPSLDDLGGADCENDDDAPDEAKDMTAAKGNQWPRQIEGLARVAASAIVSVRYSAGTPVIDSAKGPGNAVLPVGFFGALVDNAMGDTTIPWTLGQLPPPGCKPEATINGLTVGMICAEYVTSGGDVVGVRVVTKDTAGAAADLPFTVRVN